MQLERWCSLNAKLIIEQQWRDADFVQNWNMSHKPAVVVDCPNASYTTFFTYVGHIPSTNTFILGYNKNDEISYVIYFEYDIEQSRMLSTQPMTIENKNFLKHIENTYPNIVHIKI